MSHNCAYPANFENIRGNRSITKTKIFFIVFIVGMDTNRGKNHVVTYLITMHVST